jgi:hypothetical protein
MAKMTTAMSSANAMAQYGIAVVVNSDSSGEVFQSSMRLSKFTHRLNVKFLIVNGKLRPRWDRGILFQRGVICHASPQKRAGHAPTLYRRDTDREKPPS